MSYPVMIQRQSHFVKQHMVSTIKKNEYVLTRITKPWKCSRRSIHFEGVGTLVRCTAYYYFCLFSMNSLFSFVCPLGGNHSSLVLYI